MLQYKKWKRLGFLASADSYLDAPVPGVVLFITLLGNNQGWQFQWPATGAAYYRVILRGKQLDLVTATDTGMQTYVYDGVGFLDYPPPLEIVEETTQAASEINKPFLTIQWYGSTAATYYEVEEYVSSAWVVRFETAEVGATVYTWTSPLLVDGTTHLYRVTAYNSIEQGSTPLEFDISPVVTPPDFVETLYNVDYDEGTNEIIVEVIT